MRPGELSAAEFAGYPAAARAFAVEFLPLLRALPLNLCAAFLQEIRGLDWRFPVEQERLRMQCAALREMTAAQRERLLAPFAAVDSVLERVTSDWVDRPSLLMEQFTADLWRTGRIEEFRGATQSLFAELPEPALNDSTMVMLLMGAGAAPVRVERAFGRLRRQGVFLPSMQTTREAVLRSFAQGCRAGAYANWSVSGGARPVIETAADAGVIGVSYTELEPVRRRILELMDATIRSGGSGPEALRDRMRAAPLSALGVEKLSAQLPVQRLMADVFTDGSGTQLYSTSFVQWTVREVLRRARPRRMLLEYTARDRQRNMNELMTSESAVPAKDAEGSRVDAEMGSYLGWLEARAVTQPGKVTMLVWHEGTSQAVLVAPGAPAGTTYAAPAGLDAVLRSFA